VHQKKNGSEQLQLDSENDSGLSTFQDRVLEHCLYGIDLDLRAVRLAKLNLFLRAIDTPNQLPRLKIVHKNSLVWSDLAKPFKFEKEFPLVHEAGGFDVVIGNPPWEKWKPDSQEFFEEYYEGFKSLPAQEAKKVRVEILKAKMGVRKKWEDNLREYEIYSDYYHQNYSFQSTAAAGRMTSGDLDLYKLFTERAYMLLKEGGLAGLVIPSGIYTDLGAKGLRGMLFDKCSMKELYSFENRGHAIFEDVHASYKFVLLSFEKGGSTKQFPCAFFLHSGDDLKKAIEQPTILSVDFVKKSSPTSWGVLEIKSERDKKVVEKLLGNPTMGEQISGAWNIELSRGFDMTQDSSIFREGKLDGVPMLEGKNIEQFTHQWKEAPKARYTILPQNLQNSEKVPPSGKYWLGFRRIASSTNYRTLIATIIPPGYCCAESITFVKDKPDNKLLCYLCGVLNSFILDYYIRQKVSANINMFHFLELPIPRISSGELYDIIARKTAQLVSTTTEFDPLKKELGIPHGLKDENDRLLARAQLDVAVAKLYGITKEDLAYILEKFPNVDSKQKELVMREYA